MNSNPKISIIVPVYNVEKYLDECVNSIINQTYKNIEIILVDDGSKDACGAMCDAYGRSDARIKVVHKQNGGLSSARNAGLDVATGDYIGFIDSDDYISLDMFEDLFKLIASDNADLSMCGIYDLYDDGATARYKAGKIYHLDSIEAAKIVMRGRLNTTIVCNKLYKASIFKQLRFPVGKIMEDDFVILDILLQCTRVVLTTDAKYYYRHREASITTISFTEKDLDTIEAYERNYRIVEFDYPQLKSAVKGRLCWANFLVFDRVLQAPYSEFNARIQQQTYHFLKKNAGLILFSNQFRIKRKLAFLGLLINLRLYKLALGIKNKNIKLQ